MNQREIALEIIYKTIGDSSYTNLLMRNKLKELEPVQRPFVSNLVGGVLKNYDYLIYQVSDSINNKTSLRNKVILAMAIYEKFYLNKEDYIVLNEYVNLAKNKFDKSFINAVLHNLKKLKEADEEYINESLPKWIYNLLKKQYSEEDFKNILKNYKRVPTLFYRLNHNKAKFEDFENIEVINKNIFTSKKNLLNSEAMANGLFYVQDINSASLIDNLDLKEDDVLLDMCSAPGSKLFNCLDIVKPENSYSNELHEKRLNLIKNKAELLGFEGIHYLNYDGIELQNVLDLKFDKIILDVPCSGLGTLSRKPDLKYHIRPESLDELQLIQKDLLISAKNLIKDGGIILYSTCTLNKKENGKQIEKFLMENERFTLLKEETIINEDGDCFYYAKLGKGYNR
ncbi:MAG: transcription antitermination factor NusB [Erysipelotrichaceae bacterium]|nr:transcription antitermination factor NusB [Erysipelotrichaceae bacterium]